MKCTIHNTTDAVGQCSKCGSFLCNVCVASEEDGKFMCEKCLMFSTFAAMTQRRMEVIDKQGKKVIDDGVKKQTRRTSIILIAIAVTIIIAAIELVWYFNISPTDIEKFNPSENVFATSTRINRAIVTYREDHNGEVPDSLDELVGKYLPDDQLWKNSLWDFYYNKITPYKYELVPPETDNDIPNGLIFTDEGIEVVGME